MKTYDPNSRKPHFRLKCLLGPNLGHQFFFFFFFKNLVPSVTRYNGQISSCKISEKTNDPILRKLSYGWTDGQTDRLTDRRTRFIS